MPLACGSGCAHPVSLAHSTCALFPVSRVRRWCAVQHAIFRLSLISLRTKCTVDVELLAAFLDVDLHAVTTTLLWRRKWWMHIIHGQGVDRLRLQPVGSPWLSHVASVMLPQSRGSSCGARAAAWPPRDIRPKNLDELVGPSFACEMVQRLFAEESGSSAGRWTVAMSTLVWARASSDEKICVKKSTESLSSLWSLCCLEKIQDQRLIIDARIPNTVSKRLIQSCSPRTNPLHG